ncbi:MAG: hypothetical protein KAG95_04380 [Bacteroidales bacterium]|nr:hypothetical protein [Bacteroidales bacterium]
MKTIKNLIIFTGFVLFWTTNIVAQPGPDPDEVIRYTPKGTPVVALKIYNDWWPSDIEEVNNYFSTTFPNAIVIGNASMKYNCHSYALHRTEGNWYDIVWIDGDEAIKYYTDKSYIRVNNFNDASNLKIKYRDNSDIITHSANKTNNQNMIISKWGPYALYKHTENYVPPGYIGKTNQYYVSTKISGPKNITLNKVYQYSVENINGGTYTWSTSSNIHVVSNYGNQIKIQAISNIIANTWVKVLISSNTGHLEDAAITKKYLKVGIEHVPGLKAYNINVFPNPVNEYLNINFVEKEEYKNVEDLKLNYEILFFDKNNNLIYRDESNKKFVQIKLKDLKKDRYFIQIIQGEDKFTKQIIVN